MGGSALATRTTPHPVGGNGDVFLRGADALGIEARVGPVAIANGRFGNRPHCIYRGFCLQGCKVNAKASPLITHIPDALAHGAEIRPDCHVSRVLIDDAHRPGHRRRVLPRRAWSAASGPGRSPSPATRIETPRLLLLSADRRHPGRPGQRPRPARPLPDGAGRAADRRPLRRGDADVQGAAAGGEQRAVLRDRPHQAVPAGLVDPDGQPAADHLGRARRPRRGTGGRCCASTCATTCTGRRSGRCASSCRSRTTGSPSPTRTTGTACRWRTSPTASATTTSCSWPRPASRWRTILRAAGASEVMTIERYAHLVGGARMAAPRRGRRRRPRAPGLRRRQTCYIVDGSVLPTQGSANPALTIMALAARRPTG